jgi:uncharacterized repeat protein (TIGR01451 family)
LSRPIWIASALTAAVYGQVNILTWHNDNARTGQNLQETILTPANVNVSTFGKLFAIGVDGKVDAQPLYVSALAIAGQGIHNVLFVMTEHHSAYAFDADTGAQLWHSSLLGDNETPSDNRGCGQVTPEIGITSTPAIDLHIGSHGTMYAVAVSKDNSGNYHQRLHALDLTTGAEEFGGPVEVQATYPGSGSEGTSGVQTFDPKQHEERAALAIANGVVYTSWGSHCDVFPYTGWVIGYSETTLAQVNVLNLTPNGDRGGIWSAGSGPALDAAGNLYLLMGNGTFDTTLNGDGFPVNGDYGNAFVKLSPAGAVLPVADYFTMHDTTAESSADQDLGSGGAMVLPPLNDAQGQPRALAVGAGKDSHIYVVDRNNMGKYNAGANAIYEDMTTALNGQVFSSPAWFNGKLYYGASGDTLKAFAFLNGTFGAAPVSQSATVFGAPGTTPAVSANGTSNGIVWTAENAGTAVLHAFDSTNLSNELYNSNEAANGRDHFGAGNKFIVPTVANGKVYVGTTSGVGVFGLLCFSIAKTHSGSFTQGQNGAAYSVTVSKAAGTCPINGTVTVTDTLPAGLTLVSMAGTGWTCAGNSCMRSDPLANGMSYPAIAVTVNVASDASSPLVNQVSVMVGGSASANASDSTIINVNPPVNAGDFNGDGHEDLIWRADTTRQVTVHYYGGAGGATFQGWNFLNAGGVPGWTVVAAADFDGNGVPDLVWMNNQTRQVTVHYYGGAGGATFLGWSWLNAGGVAGWTVVGAADFDGNGTPDLIWQNDATRQVTVHYYGGAGGATFQGWNWLNAGGVVGWTVAGAADFDGNGTPDLIWQNNATRQVTVHYYGGAGGATFQGWNYLNAAGIAGWSVAGANDFDGNGVPDLVWQSDSTRQVTVHSYGGAQGATFTGWQFLNSGGVPGWHVLVPH